MVSARIQPLNVQHVFKGSYVLYILRCLRTKYSAAFSFASERANKSQVPLIALHLYVPGFIFGLIYPLLLGYRREEVSERGMVAQQHFLEIFASAPEDCNPTFA